MRKLMILMLLALLIVPTLANAQDDWNTHTHESGGITISYPEGWYVADGVPDEDEEPFQSINITNNEELSNMEILSDTLSNGQVAIFVTTVTETQFQELSATGLSGQPLSLVSGYIIGYLGLALNIQTMFSDDADPNYVTVIEYTETELASYETGLTMLEMNGNDILLSLMKVDDETFIWSMAATAEGEFADFEDIIMQILESITLTEME